MLSRPINIVVLADTHVNGIHELPLRLTNSLRKADAIIHLGDYVTPELLNDLRSLGNFHGIMGNHDNLIGRQELKVTDVVEIGGKKMGLIHGLFIPIARPKRIMAMFRKNKVDIILFGHNHLAINKMRYGKLFFNPGTVTCRFPATQGSYGVLTLDENGCIAGKIVTLENQSCEPERFLMKISAIIIRNGIRWLEAWPYIDLRGHWQQLSLALKRLINSFRLPRFSK